MLNLLLRREQQAPAWKTAGYYGLDRYLLPLLGTPWQPIPIKQVRKDAAKSKPIPQPLAT